MERASGMRSRTWWLVRLVAPILLLCLQACAMVGVSRLKPHDVVAESRADVLGSGRLSDSTVQALNVVALTTKPTA